jgi:NO-binding membrane sensor protein with MHYT domain
MAHSPKSTQRNTYTAYSIGCAGVWGVILLLGRRRLDPKTWNTLWLVCSGWWMGWTSATIARLGYPPPKQLTPAGEKRLRIISIVLIALGLASTSRMFAAGKRPPVGTPGA